MPAAARRSARELAHVRPRLTAEVVAEVVARHAASGSSPSLPPRVDHWTAGQLEDYLQSGGAQQPIDAAIMETEPDGVNEGELQVVVPSRPSHEDTELASLLDSLRLSHLREPLLGCSLAALAQLVVNSRPELLGQLKRDGVASLSERQKLANAFGKAARERGYMKTEPKPFGSWRRRRELAAAAAVPVALDPSKRPFTIAGKTDGFGAQLQAQMSGVAYAASRPGDQYVHSPLGRQGMDEDLHGPTEDEDGPDMDHFAGMGSFSPRWVDLPDDALGDIVRHEYIKTVHDATSGDLGTKYYTPEVRQLLRDRYYSTPKPHLPAACGGGDGPPGVGANSGEGDSGEGDSGEGDSGQGAGDGGIGYVAIHVRRGDISEDRPYGRFTPNRVYATLLPLLAERHPGLPIVIFSQGSPADFGELTGLASPGTATPSLDVRLCLNGSIRTTFHALVCATALVVARSSFSYSAALLSEGTVYSDLITDWWHKPLPEWKQAVAQAEGKA